MAKINITIEDKGIKTRYYAFHTREGEDKVASMLEIQNEHGTITMDSRNYSAKSLRIMTYEIEHGAMNGGLEEKSIERKIKLSNIAF